MPSNSIVDSGTNCLDMSSQMLDAMLSRFTAQQHQLLTQAIDEEKPVAVAELRLEQWPAITFVLEGETGDVRLEVPPANYWQVNSQEVGFATAAITRGQPGIALLGLPLMNGYFTIFDGEADGGRGVIKFATSKR